MAAGGSDEYEPIKSLRKTPNKDFLVAFDDFDRGGDGDDTYCDGGATACDMP